MTDKSLASKAINIKGKKYVLVSDRVTYFNEVYVNGMIQTSMKSEPESKQVVVMAKVTPDVKNPDRYFTGYSQAIVGEGMVNKTAALENAETSAVGRALAFMGIGVIDSVASVDEINKAGNQDLSKIDPTDIMDQAMIKQGVCKKCGAKMVKNPKTGSWFCERKCWTNKEQQQNRRVNG